MKSIRGLSSILAVIFVVLNLCSHHVESRPRRLSSLVEANFATLIIPSQYLDYDYPDFQIPQGPRRRRWAFPVDVQDSMCPPGQRRHTSGYGCVSDEEDDY